MKNIYSLKTNTQEEEGFTLIELVITIVIIGVLAAIAVLVFIGQQKAAITATVKSDVANARSFIPGKLGKVTPASDFAAKVSLTDRNTALYAVSADSLDACYQVSHAFSSSEIATYRYLTTEGVVKEGTCSTFASQPGTTTSQINPSNENTAPTTGNGSEAAKPGDGSSAETPNSGGNNNSGTVVVPPATTTNEYVDGVVSLANIHNDWAGVYTARITITPKQNKVALWTVKWTDPSVTGIEASPNANCSVASGGVITCSGIPNNYTTENLQWGQTVVIEVQLKTTNKNTAPTNPNVAVTATAK